MSPADIPTTSANTATLPARELDQSQLRQQLSAAKTESEMWRIVASSVYNAFEADGVQLEITASSPAITASRFDGKQTRTAWSRICDALLLRVQRMNRPIARTCNVPAFENRAAIGVPIHEGGEDADGAMVVVVPRSDEATLRKYIQDVEAAIRLVQVTLSELSQKKPEQTAQQSAADAVVRAARYQSLGEYAFAITNGLKTKLDCDEVALGVIASNRAKVLSISGLDENYPRTPGSLLIRQAMEECLDRQDIISWPANDPTAITPMFSLHQQWQQQSGSSFVASFPLLAGDDCVGVVSVRTSNPQGFSETQISTVQQILKPLAPGLVLLQKAEKPLSGHVRDSARNAISRLRPDSRTTKIAWTMCTLIALWAVFGRSDYVVTVPCRVIAENMTEVAAPFAGRIATALVEPGDQVQAGQLLLEFDTSEVESRRRQALAEYEIAQMELAVAVRQKNAAAAGTARNRAHTARLSADLAGRQLKQARVFAERDGVILEGDLRSRVGETVATGTPLFRIAPSGSLAVELDVTEHAAAFVQSGQAADFVLSARPNEKFSSRMRRVNPSSQVVEGQNVFSGIAIPEPASSDLSWLRPGMQGVAQVNTGPQRVWWVWLHDVVDTVQLALWSL